MNKMKYALHSLGVAFALAGAMVMSSCGKTPTNTSTSGIATIVCDDSFENILNQEIDVFEYIYPKASIIPYYVPEKAAIDSLLTQSTKTIIVTRELTEQEKNYLKNRKLNVKQRRIAVDAIALIVNKDNPIEILMESEIGEILTGELACWNDIEPSKLDSIKVVFDHQNSSTVQYMRENLMAGKPFGKNVFAQGSNAGVFEAVQGNKNAIGIIGVSWVSADMRTAEMSREERVKALGRNDTTTTSFNADVKVLKVRPDDSIIAHQPYQAYIYDGSYPLYRSIYMITTAANGSIAHGFYSFVTGFNGQKIIQTTGILPASVQPRMVQLN